MRALVRHVRRDRVGSLTVERAARGGDKAGSFVTLERAILTTLGVAAVAFIAAIRAVSGIWGPLLAVLGAVVAGACIWSELRPARVHRILPSTLDAGALFVTGEGTFGSVEASPVVAFVQDRQPGHIDVALADGKALTFDATTQVTVIEPDPRLDRWTLPRPIDEALDWDSVHEVLGSLDGQRLMPAKLIAQLGDNSQESIQHSLNLGLIRRVPLAGTLELTVAGQIYLAALARMQETPLDSEAPIRIEYAENVIIHVQSSTGALDIAVKDLAKQIEKLAQRVDATQRPAVEEALALLRQHDPDPGSLSRAARLLQDLGMDVLGQILGTGALAVIAALAR